MKADKIRNMNAGEIERQVQDSQEQLFRLRFQMGMGQSEGLKKYRSLRKDRARLLTILNESRRGADVEAAPAPVAGSGKKASTASSGKKK